MSRERFNMGDDPLSLEELTERVVELSEKVARLEAIAEELKRSREEIRQEMRRLDAKMDRLFWLWVSTIAAAFVLRVLGLV